MREFLRFSRRFLDYTVGRNRRMVFITMAVVCVGYVAKAGLALALKLFADTLEAGEGRAAVVSLVLLVLLMVASRSEQFFVDYVAVHQYHTAAHAFENHLLALDLTLPRVDHLEDPDYLDRFELLKGDVENLVKILWTWVRIAAAGVQTLLSTMLLVQVHPVLALFPLAAVPLVWADARGSRILDGGRLAAAEHNRLEGRLHSIVTEAATAKESKVAGAEAALDQHADEAWRRATSALFGAEAKALLLSSAAWLIFGAAQIAVLGWVGLRVARGQAELGDVPLVVTLGLQARSQFGTFVWNASRGLSTNLAFGRYRDVVSLHEEKTALVADPLPAPARLDDGIRLDNVSFRYSGAATDSLHGVDLHLPAGSTVAIVGENGAGKSTLVKLLCGLYEATGGRITVDGSDLARIPPDVWRAQVAGLFQDFARLQFTAGDAVGVGDLSRREDEDALTAAVERANAGSVLSVLPNGYATQLGRLFPGGVELSGGQWQRIALAQTMMRASPLLLVLDEPASALDPFAEHDLFERYAEAASSSAALRGSITVFVSHRFSTVLMAEEIIVMDKGRVVDHGSHQELMERGGLYAELYGLQKAAYAAEGG